LRQSCAAIHPIRRFTLAHGADILLGVRQSPPPMKQAYLAFRLGEQEYATSLDPILEVRAYDALRLPTRIFVNAMQEHIPVVNLRKRLALGEFPLGGLPVAIVLEIAGALLAVAVDGVVETFSLEPGQVVPAIHTEHDGLHVTGVAAIRDRRFLIVDFEPLADEELPRWAR
jgi:purine-binding chemotaxis protein CheW